MFRHYRVILRQPAINTLPSYTGISNAAVGNAVYRLKLVQYSQYSSRLTDSYRISTLEHNLG